MRWIVLMLTVAGCGSSSPSDRLAGGWVYAASASSAVGFNFDDGAFVFQRIALTSATSANDEMTAGRYEASDDQLTLTPEKSTCPGPAGALTFRYQFQGRNLALVDAGGIVLFEPNNAPATGGASIVLGCFDAAGGFAPMPLVPLS